VKVCEATPTAMPGNTLSTINQFYFTNNTISYDRLFIANNYNYRLDITETVLAKLVQFAKIRTPAILNISRLRSINKVEGVSIVATQLYIKTWFMAWRMAFVFFFFCEKKHQGFSKQ
jgi:hypothetical protein